MQSKWQEIDDSILLKFPRKCDGFLMLHDEGWDSKRPRGKRSELSMSESAMS